MRQVPQYLIIGDGGVARHMCHYFSLLDAPWVQWSRRANQISELSLMVQQSSHVLLLVSDGAIESVADLVQRHHTGCSDAPKLVHFSGSLHTNKAYGAHPLQSFKRDAIYTLEDYQCIPFMIDTDAPDFSALLPVLSNPHHRMRPEDRPYYHAMCMLANNVTTMLWQQVHHRMRDRFGMELKDLRPLMERTFKHIADDPDRAMTGPWVRGDIATLQRNQQALDGDALQGIWLAVMDFYGYGGRDENDS